MQTSSQKILAALVSRAKPSCLHGLLGKALVMFAAVFAVLWASQSLAQTVLSVPFTNGYVGKDDSSPNTSVQTYTFGGIPGLPTGGITGAYFSQDVTTGTTQFKNCAGTSFLVGETLDLCSGSSAQGNDVPGFITLTDAAGNAYKLGGYFNFRGPSGKISTYVFRVLQSKIVGGLSFTPDAISATNDNLNYSMIGLVLIGKTQESSITTPADGDGTFKGDAAPSQVLTGLNEYLLSVVSNRPAGPVTVTSQSTMDTTPTLTGTVTLATGETLSVVVNGVRYVQGDGKLSVAAGVWTLQIPDAQAMPLATYDVDATITNASGYALTDSTGSELLIYAAPRFVDPADATVTAYSESYAEGATTSTILKTVKALDADSATLTYSIVTNVLNAGSQPLFTIDSATGAIRLTAAGVASFANDYETAANIHSLTVRASDGSHSTDATVTLTETNLPEGSLGGHVTKTNGHAQAGLTVTLYQGTEVVGTTTTDANGAYSFAGLSAATYSVRFGDEFTGLGIKGKSPVGRNGQAEVTEVTLTEAVSLTNVDGFVVDPSGVVYSSTTRLPVEGAKVELYVTPTGQSRRLVADAELDTGLGDANGVLTGADGVYSFLLKDSAPTGVYDLVVAHAAYVSPSTDLPAAEGPYLPSLGGGAETIQAQATAPTGTQPTTYYLSFSFTFTEGDPAQTSNGVVNNHIPLDPVQAAMTVTKSVNESAVAEGAVAGAVLTYTITAENTGNVALGNVSTSDKLTGDSAHDLTLTRSGANSADTSFDVDDIWTWTVSYTLLQADIDAGQVENYASVTGTPSGGSALTVYSGAKGVASTATTAPATGSGVVTTLTTAATVDPAMTVAKTVDETALLNGAAAGDVLSYTITAVNTGNVTLASVAIADPLTEPATPVRAGASVEDTSFDSGDVWVWTVDYTLTQADIDAGKVENYASVTGTPSGGDPLTVYSAAKGVASSAIVAPASGNGPNFSGSA